MSPEAIALATDVAMLMRKAGATHNDKFDALVALISALGVPAEHHLKIAEKIISGEITDY